MPGDLSLVGSGVTGQPYDPADTVDSFPFDHFQLLPLWPFPLTPPSLGFPLKVYEIWDLRVAFSSLIWPLKRGHKLARQGWRLFFSLRVIVILFSFNVINFKIINRARIGWMNEKQRNLLPKMWNIPTLQINYFHWTALFIHTSTILFTFLITIINIKQVLMKRFM